MATYKYLNLSASNKEKVLKLLSPEVDTKDFKHLRVKLEFGEIQSISRSWLILYKRLPNEKLEIVDEDKLKKYLGIDGIDFDDPDYKPFKKQRD